MSAWGEVSFDLSSPRAWGCFEIIYDQPASEYVFPTCVGVFRDAPVLQHTVRCLPHVRGGVSCSLVLILLPLRSSPRAWGCFSMQAGDRCRRRVFPTCVGVFLAKALVYSLSHRLPHVRGGVSRRKIKGRHSVRSSPRAWGCFQACGLRRCSRDVFPTCVGVFLVIFYSFFGFCCLPHVRGGVSLLSIGMRCLA